MEKTFFYASSPKWFRSNRLYKIYAGKNNLHGLKVGTQLSDSKYAETLLFAIIFGGLSAISQNIYSLVTGLPILALIFVFTYKKVKKSKKQREEWEKKYDSINLESKDVLSVDKDNFSWKKEDIDLIKIKRKSAYAYLWQGANAYIDFMMKDQSKKRFVIVADQDIEDIKNKLSVISKVELL
jgi:hypothetical protein